MRLLAGTSGFSYKEWLGEFYPEKLAASKMLSFYATRLPTVEINNTFYRMPNAAAIQGWRAQVPSSFVFAIKAPRRISHLKRLRDSADDVRVLLAAIAELGPSFGSLLVQLPPHAKCELAALEAFLGHLPPKFKAAFEFRNPTWIVPPVLELLRAHDAALVQSESADGYEPLPWTASWAYLRLRKVAYTEQELNVWLERLEDSGVGEAQVFFKHEDAATGPKLALRLLEIARRA
jgi:uncharacterized protein YecE (DUF72 family)